ncbi:Pycsar system effector family protein [Gordonia sp. NPDC127522]|uniref:Pycsar system effector family protein n=1 Tax=Gordonia sp. NPDC127522 TaxID=3345390 RepID=UPI00363D4741
MGRLLSEAADTISDVFRDRGRGGCRKTDVASAADSGAAPDPDHAWKALSLVNEWIRHSDAKAGVTLAFVGVMGTLTFNLTKDLQNWSLPVVVAAAAACTFMVTAVGLCAWTLTPRVKDKDDDADSKSLLFFASISSHYKGGRPRYRTDLSTLSADPAALTEQLADQVHANALIATVKNRSAKWAIRAAVAAGAAVAMLALTTNITNTPTGADDGRQLQGVQLHEQLGPDQGDPESAGRPVRGG